MSLRLYCAPSFARSLKRLGYEQKKIVGLILESLTVYYAGKNDLSAARQKAPLVFINSSGSLIPKPE